MLRSHTAALSLRRYHKLHLTDKPAHSAYCNDSIRPHGVKTLNTTMRTVAATNTLKFKRRTKRPDEVLKRIISALPAQFLEISNYESLHGVNLIQYKSPKLIFMRHSQAAAHEHSQNVRHAVPSRSYTKFTHPLTYLLTYLLTYSMEQSPS
jgi:hypothetical protein